MNASNLLWYYAGLDQAVEVSTELLSGKSQYLYNAGRAIGYGQAADPKAAILNMTKKKLYLFKNPRDVSEALDEPKRGGTLFTKKVPDAENKGKQYSFVQPPDPDISENYHGQLAILLFSKIFVH